MGLTPGESYLAGEWGKVAFNPDAIYYTSVSQGSKCDVFIDISSRTRRVFLGLTPQNNHLGRRNTEKSHLGNPEANPNVIYYTLVT